MYAVEKLDWILNDATRNKIRFVMLERLRQEFHPDVQALLKKALSPEYKSGEPAIYFSSSWFEDAVLFFRKIGFFQEYINLADHELIERIKEARQYGPDNKLPSTIDLLLILAEDKKRIWFRDAETYFDQEYVNLLQEWGNISRGTFLPENIVETRNEDDEKILISFSHNNKPWEIYVNDYGDWIDTSIFEEINEIIGDSGVQFFNIPTDSQEVYIVSISAFEKLQLEKYLRLKFEISGRFISPPKL
jgi:hypothetical protein